MLSEGPKADPIFGPFFAISLNPFLLLSCRSGEVLLRKCISCLGLWHPFDNDDFFPPPPQSSKQTGTLPYPSWHFSMFFSFELPLFLVVPPALSIANRALETAVLLESHLGLSLLIIIWKLYRRSPRLHHFDSKCYVIDLLDFLLHDCFVLFNNLTFGNWSPLLNCLESGSCPLLGFSFFYFSRKSLTRMYWVYVFLPGRSLLPPLIF